MSTHTRPLANLRAVLVVLLLAAMASVGFSGAASASTSSSLPQPILKAAAQALKSHYVYVNPNVTQTNLDSQKVKNLESSIQNGKGKHPIFVAVLPVSVMSEVGGDPRKLPTTLHSLTGRAGAYAILVATPRGGFVVNTSFAAGIPQSKDYSTVDYKPGDAYGTLSTFVNDVEQLPVATNSVTIEKKTPWGWIIFGSVLGLIAAGTLVYFVLRRRKLTQDKAALGRKLENLQQDIFNLPAYTDMAAIDQLNLATSKLLAAQDLLGKVKVRSELEDAEALYKEAVNYKKEAKRLEDAADRARTAGTPSVRTVPSGSSEQYSSSPSSAPVYAASGSSSSASSTSTGRQRQPQKTVNVTNNYYDGYSGPAYANYYPGTGYGYYPSIGWGYYGFGGGFVEGMLLGELMADGSVRDHDTIIVENNDYDPNVDAYDNTGMDGDASASGDFGNGSPAATDDTNMDGEASASGDFGGGDVGAADPDVSPRDNSVGDGNYDGGSGDFGGGGYSDPAPAYDPSPAYDPAPANDPAPDWGGGGGGYDGGGGGDFGGGDF